MSSEERSKHKVETLYVFLFSCFLVSPFLFLVNDLSPCVVGLPFCVVEWLVLFWSAGCAGIFSVLEQGRICVTPYNVLVALLVLHAPRACSASVCVADVTLNTPFLCLERRCLLAIAPTFHSPVLPSSCTPANAIGC